jgi:miniconductance mechanosensitive channel
MFQALQLRLSPFFSEPWARISAAMVALVLVAALAYVVVHRVVQRVMRELLTRLSLANWDEALTRHGFYRRLAQMAPPVVFQFGILTVPDLTVAATEVLRNLALAATLLFGMLMLSAAMSAANDAFATSTRAHTRSIKGYLQLGKIVLWAFGTIVIVATIIDRSPLLLLSGLGAMSAVLLLVFKDTLLSFVASVQLTSNDMLRVGDWIEMPQVGADGFVIDIALHTVKVENWDKTITTIPTYRLFSDSFRNWRTMFTSGGRRIKRTMRLDAGSVRFLRDGEMEQLRRFRLLGDYLDQKQKAITEANQELGDPGHDPVNQRRLTNLGTFRAYTEAYLKQHPGINTSMTLMVRMLEPGDKGIPIELYCFTASTAWVSYEQVQGDIFDHLLSILPELGLRLYQSPAGNDLVTAFADRSASPAMHARIEDRQDRQSPDDARHGEYRGPQGQLGG